MRGGNLLVGLFLFITGMNTASAGIIPGGTRVIFPEANREVSLSIRNSDKATDYLVQSWLDNENDGNTARVPFVITPPLFRLDREKESILRIATTGASLPADRESLYWLSIKGIAATQKNQEQNHLQVVVRHRLKLIYRPRALNSQGAAEAYKSLQFRRQGQTLIINNPTPYYVSFFSLKVGGVSVDNPGMVTPFGEHRVSASGSGVIEWQSVNDFGASSPVARQ